MLLAAADPNFNSDFYVTIATIVPILLVLLVLQLRLFDVAVEESRRRLRGRGMGPIFWPGFRGVARELRRAHRSPAYYVMAAVVWIAIVTEFFAVLSLYLRDSDTSFDVFMLVTVGVLLNGILIAVLLAWRRAVSEVKPTVPPQRRRPIRLR